MQSIKFAVVFCFKKQKPRLIFKQYNWLNSKTRTLCSFHCFVLPVCLCFCVAGLAVNEIVSRCLVNNFVHFHRYVWRGNTFFKKGKFYFSLCCFSLYGWVSIIKSTARVSSMLILNTKCTLDTCQNN